MCSVLYRASFSVNISESLFMQRNVFTWGGGIIQNDMGILQNLFLFICEINEHIFPYLVDNMFLFLLVIMKNI